MSPDQKRRVVLDERRRTSLARVGHREHHEYLVDEQPDGTLVLVPAVTISAEEFAILSNPELRESLTRKVDRKKLRSRGDFTKYAK